MNKPVAIKEIVLEKIHGHQSSRIQLNPGLNIIFGKNGTGKTTLLHVIVNLLERDIERFLNVSFKSISITTYAGNAVRLEQKIRDDKPYLYIYIDEELKGEFTSDNISDAEIESILHAVFDKRPVYFPAYRNILEGTYKRRAYYRGVESDVAEKEFGKIVQRERQIYEEAVRSNMRLSYLHKELTEFTAFKTILCREWFGDFVPTIRYPSINEVHKQLEEEIEMARYAVAAADEENISKVFTNVLKIVLSKDAKSVEDSVDTLLQGFRKYISELAPEAQGLPTVYTEIATMLSDRTYSDIQSSDNMIKGILKVYTDALSKRKLAKESAYEKIEKFMISVNKFLETKPIGYEYRKMPRRAMGKSFVTLPGGKKVSFNVLSSGERHILSLLFASTHMSGMDGIVIIDEPELSLHLDWQRIILGEIQEQAGDRQIIACTHSPEVAAEHMDKYIVLKNDPALLIADDDDLDNPQLELERLDK